MKNIMAGKLLMGYKVVRRADGGLYSSLYVSNDEYDLFSLQLGIEDPREIYHKVFGETRNIIMRRWRSVSYDESNPAYPRPHCGALTCYVSKRKAIDHMKRIKDSYGYGLLLFRCNYTEALNKKIWYIPNENQYRSYDYIEKAQLDNDIVLADTITLINLVMEGNDV